MTYHRYPLRSLVWDYLRAAVGILVTMLPLVLGKPGWFFFTLLATVAGLFFLYGLRTLSMQLTALEIRGDGLMSHGPRKRLFAWNGLSRVHMRYYSTQRDKSRRDMKGGWMELKITAAPGTLRIDSEVSGFDEIVEAVAAAAEWRQLELDETTAENLKAFKSGGTPPPPQAGVKDEDMRW